MNTKDIEAFALAEYRKEKDNEDNWVSFSDDWDLNIYMTEWETDVVKCAVFPVIDGQIDTSVCVYFFNFPREN
jgi:hypothetical protein